MSLNKKESKDYKFIINFNRIKLSTICKKLNLNRSSLYQGSLKVEDFKAIREEIESELAKLYLKDEKDG